MHPHAMEIKYFVVPLKSQSGSTFSLFGCSAVLLLIQDSKIYLQIRICNNVECGFQRMCPRLQEMFLIFHNVHIHFYTMITSI